MVKQEIINYEVWGLDVFSHEYYLCGTFTSRVEAEKVLLEKQESVKKTQDASIRDSHWIVEITDEKVLERQDREKQIWKEKHDELLYNSRHLKKCIRKLLKLLRSSLKTVKCQTFNDENNREFKQEVPWKKTEDCFNKVYFESFYHSNQTLDLSIGVTVRSGKYYGGSRTLMYAFSGTIDEMIQWSKTEKAFLDCLRWKPNAYVCILRHHR